MSTKPKPWSPKRIIRGASVEGFTLCQPHQNLGNDPATPQKEHSFNIRKALLRKMALQKVKANELEEIWEAGIDEGYRKGIQEGQKQGYEVGKEEGFEKGFEEGAEQVKAELKVAIDLTNAIANRLAVKREDMFDQAKPEILKFCLNVCEKLIRQELSHSHTFVKMLETLLDQAKSILKDSSVHIFLAPEDIEMLQKQTKSLDYDKESFKKIHFIPDPLMSRGDCRVETSLGLVNFDIKRLLANLEEKVLGINSNYES